MNPYNYTGDVPEANLRLLQTTPKWQRYTIDFPSAYRTRHEENNTIRGEYFQPRDVDRAPLVIIHHGIGDELLIPSRLLARALAKRGMACFVFYSVFHSKRMPETVSKRLPHITPEEWFEGYRISVINARQVIDWAGGRGEINEAQTAVIGISFGGFISAITMGVDKRVKAGVFLIAAGNSEKIGQKCRKNTLKKRYRRTEAEYRRRQSRYYQYLAEVAVKGFEQVTSPNQNFLIDPMTFSARLRERPMLMLNALWDEYIPREAALDFWEACGRPDIAWFPAAHTTFWLWYPFISRKITRFLKSTFDNQDASLV